jgi:hypothetical protein
MFIPRVQLAPGGGLEVVCQQFHGVPCLIPIAWLLFVLEVLVLKGDPREMENPVKQGKCPEAALGCDKVAVWSGKSLEIERRDGVDTRNDAEEDLTEPWIDMVQDEKFAELL